MFAQLIPFWRRIRRYYADYGGASAVFGSPLFIVAVLVTAVSYTSWLSDTWTSMSQSIVPGMLGFSLGTYAILFSLMTNRLKSALKTVKNNKGVSYLDEVNATFLHFILVQTLALLFTFVYKSTLTVDVIAIFVRNGSLCDIAVYLTAVGGAVGYLLLVYSVALTVGAALAVYRLAAIVDPRAE